jgi:hypothetical protein
MLTVGHDALLEKGHRGFGSVNENYRVVEYRDVSIRRREVD